MLRQISFFKTDIVIKVFTASTWKEELSFFLSFGPPSLQPIKQQLQRPATEIPDPVNIHKQAPDINTVFKLLCLYQPMLLLVVPSFRPCSRQSIFLFLLGVLLVTFKHLSQTSRKQSPKMSNPSGRLKEGVAYERKDYKGSKFES